jgi:AraC-like DNA-binding protein
VARGSDGASLAVCASEQPGLYGADTAAPGAVGWWSRAVGDLIWLHRACDLMDRDDAMPLDVPALARTAFMSTGHCSRSVRAAFGETPSSYLLMRRIERAKALLRRGDLRVTEVWLAVGCTLLGSFSSRSPSWSATARAPTGPAAMTRAPPSRPARPSSTHDRSGMEKPTLPPGPSMQETNNQRG